MTQDKASHMAKSGMAETGIVESMWNHETPRPIQRRNP